MKYWTMDEVGSTDGGKLYFVGRKPLGGVGLFGRRKTITVVRRYYSAQSGWPTYNIYHEDRKIHVVVGADREEAVQLADGIRNCAVYSYKNDQTHFLPIWWLPAAASWGYYPNALIGVWLDGIKHTPEDLCRKCPDRLRRSIEMCEPLVRSCKLPFSLTSEDEGDYAAFARFCALRRPEWGTLPKKAFRTFREAARGVPKASRTVDDLE